MEWLSAKELAARFEVTPRTVRNWKGAPFREVEIKGRQRKVYNPEAVQAWRDGQGGAARKVSKMATGGGGGSAAPAETLPVTAAVDLEGGSEAVRAAAASGMAGSGELLAVLGRLHKAEKASFSRYVQAMRDNDSSPQLVTALRRDWNETVKSCRELSRDVTGILVEQGQYVPAAEAEIVMTGAVTRLVSGLETLGTRCGAAIAQMVEGAERALSAEDFRAEIEREVEVMKDQLREELRGMTTAADATQEENEQTTKEEEY